MIYPSNLISITISNSGGPVRIGLGFTSSSASLGWLGLCRGDS